MHTFNEDHNIESNFLTTEFARFRAVFPHIFLIVLTGFWIFFNDGSAFRNDVRTTYDFKETIKILF